MIEHESLLCLIFLKHLFLGMQQRRFRSLSLALNTTFCCCLKFGNIITHHGLLLQDALVGEVHDLLIGYRNNLRQLRLENICPFNELRFAD